jgi:hypothetical protein
MTYWRAELVGHDGTLEDAEIEFRAEDKTEAELQAARYAERLAPGTSVDSVYELGAV